MEKNRDTVRKYIVVDDEGACKRIDPLSWESLDATTRIDNWYREYDFDSAAEEEEHDDDDD